MANLTYSPLRERSDFAVADGKSTAWIPALDMRSPMSFKCTLPVAVVEPASWSP